MKKDAFYFPHDSNAHNDPKIVSLRIKTGLEGIGFFWLVVELLRESKNYKYANDQAMLELALSLPQATLKPLLEACLEVGLFVVDDGFLMSTSLNNRMRSIDRRREILRQAGRRGNEKRWGDLHPIAKRSPPYRSKVKESKVKESKVNNTPPNPQRGDLGFDAFWKSYPKKVGKGAAEKIWLKLKPHQELLSQILKAVEIQKESDQWKKDGGQFIPNPATWLNQGRWEDEIPIDTEKEKQRRLDLERDRILSEFKGNNQS